MMRWPTETNSAGQSSNLLGGGMPQPYRRKETAASEMLAAVKFYSIQYAERIIATGRAAPMV